MKKWLKLFDRKPEPPAPAHRDAFAAAMLLIEVSYADFDIDRAEIAQAAKQLAALYGMQQADADQLLAEALVQHKEETSMYPWFARINATMDRRGKEKLLGALWQIASADGHISAHEEHRVRRIADALHVPHSAFIKTKLQSRP